MEIDVRDIVIVLMLCVMCLRDVFIKVFVIIGFIKFKLKLFLLMLFLLIIVMS